MSCFAVACTPGTVLFSQLPSEIGSSVVWPLCCPWVVTNASILYSRVIFVLFGLRFIASVFVTQGANTVWTGAATTYITIAFALFFGGLVQLLAGMWEFRRNNMFAATAFSSYGGFWLSYGIYVILTSGGVIPESGGEGLQMMLSLWGILTFFFFL